jgi:dynein heavy chain 1
VSSKISEIVNDILYRFDQRLLAAFVAKLFCQESLNTSYPLIKDDLSSLSIPMPQDTTKSKYVEWVKQLPPNEKPTWLGLPDNAEKVLLISEGKYKHDI